MAASSPAITGDFTAGFNGTTSWSSGAFWHNQGERGRSNIGDGTAQGLTRFDASRCSPIYGTSSTVRPVSKSTIFLIRY